MIVRGSTLLETSLWFVSALNNSLSQVMRIVGRWCPLPAVACRFQPMAAISLAVLGGGAFRFIR